MIAVAYGLCVLFAFISFLGAIGSGLMNGTENRAPGFLLGATVVFGGAAWGFSLIL